MKLNFIDLKCSALFKDSFWALVGSVAGKGLALVASIAIARILGKNVYGEYGMIRTTLLSMATFSTFGLGYTCTKFVADYRQQYPERVRNLTLCSMKIALVTSSLMAFFLFIFSKQIASYLNAVHLYLALRLLAINVIFNALTTTQIGILSGFNEFKKIAQNNAIAGFVTFLTSVCFTYYFGLNGSLSALLVSQIVNYILNYRSVRYCLKQFSTINSQKDHILKELLYFSLPVALQECIYTVVNWANAVLLVKLTNYGELGIYSAAAQWASIVLFIPGVLRNVTLAHLSGNVNELVKHNRIIKIMLGINLISTLVPFLIVSLLNNFICSFYGSSFSALGDVVKIAILGSVFNCLSNVYVQEYMAKGKNWFVFVGMLFCETMKFGLFLIFIYIGSNTGAYYLTLASLIMAIIFLVFLYLGYKFKYEVTKSFSLF